MTLGSLFAGIGGFDLGFERCGFQTLWQVEKDANCRKLLAAKFPQAEKFGDVFTVGVMNLKPVDMICGGFPCQDLSVAGKRAGLLGGSRSRLFYEMLRVIRETRPALVVWENVAGLSSSDDGRDMLRVCAGLGECDYFGAARIFNAQYFGVAQRRRRWFGVFARGHSGAECCAQILSLAEGLRGHPAPGGKTRQEVAGSLGSRTDGGGQRTTDLDGHGAYVLDGFAGAKAGNPVLRASGGDCGGGSECYVLAHGQANAEIVSDGEPSLTCNHEQPILITHALTANGADASEDGTGRGTPLVVTPFDTTQITSNGNYSNPKPGDASHPLAGGAHAPAIAVTGFDAWQGGDTQHGAVKDGAATLRPGGRNAVAFQTRIARSKPCVQSGTMVRRLTPTECERLQGFPDGWTAGFSDFARYKMLGNAVAVPCAEWIARRIVRSSSAPT